MITIALANNTHEVVNHVKADVAVNWVSIGGRCIDAFTRDMKANFPEFQNSLHNLPNTSQYSDGMRFNEGSAGYYRTPERVYITGVIARPNRTTSMVSLRAIEEVLIRIGNAMRVEGMTRLVIPNISTSRNSGIRTSALLDIIDRTLPDIDVYVATAVPLEPHGRSFMDIRNSYVQKPKIVVERKPVQINSGFINPYARQTQYAY